MKLELNIYFETLDELSNRLEDVKEKIKKGRMVSINPKQNFNVLLMKEPDVRFEEINGKEYMIFQSKMNQA